MSMELFQKIVDEAATVPSIDELCLTGLGEPTLDPKLVDRVKYARSSLPNVRIGVYTNGVYLTPAKFEILRDVGLSYVVVSLNAARASQHEAIMGLRNKYYIVMNNAKYAALNRGKISVEVRAVVSEDNWTEGDSAEFLALWGQAGKGGFGRLVYEGNWAGANRDFRPFKPNEACGRALGQIYVLADGKVTTCCFDPLGAGNVFGDLNKQTIREIYNFGPYVEFREAHFNNKADTYAICAGCSRI